MAHHQCEFRIDFRTLAQIFLHKLTVELQIGWGKSCRILQVFYILAFLSVFLQSLLERFFQFEGIFSCKMLRNQLLFQQVIYQPDATEIEVNQAFHPSSPTILHTNPVLERTIHQGGRRNGDDGIIEVAHLDGSERHFLHDTISIHRLHRNPVALMEHIVARKTDTRSQTRNRILENQHEDCRSGTQSSKQGKRTLAQQDGHHHDTCYKEHENPEHATESMKILLSRGPAILGIFQSFERPDENQDGSHRHHHDIDARSPFEDFLENRIFQIDKWHERPDDDSRHNMASRVEYLLIEKHIIPGSLRFLRNLGDKRHENLTAKEIAYNCQQNSGNCKQQMAENGYGIARNTSPHHHFIHKFTYFFHISSLYGWHSNSHTLSAKERALLLCIIPLLRIEKQRSWPFAALQ